MIPTTEMKKDVGRVFGPDDDDEELALTKNLCRPEVMNSVFDHMLPHLHEVFDRIAHKL